MMFLLVLVASFASSCVSNAQILDVQGCLKNDLFSLFSDVRTGSAARNFCATQGGTLARISSDEEHAFVTSLSASAAVRSFWIGVFDVNEEGGEGTSRFSYVDGSTENLQFIHTEVGAFPWGSGEPSNGRSCEFDLCPFIEFCVEWRKNDNDLFNDETCSSEKAYLCRSKCPTTFPTKSPTISPTPFPTTTSPTTSPTLFPSKSPIKSPTLSPGQVPATSPTNLPTRGPSPASSDSVLLWTELSQTRVVLLALIGLITTVLGFCIIQVWIKEKRLKDFY